MPDLLESLRDALADRYAVERELGRGGMATVFLAEDLKHHRSVAIKVLHAELTAALGAERFLREIEIAARLQHPHILPLYDSGAAAGFLYYVMPYVEGESLRDRLTREKQLPQDDAVRIATEVAGALAYAHSRGVVHRDIKPENIMLSGGTAVVTDFGIARAVSAAGAGRHLTETGTIIGTPAYMSPEQATGATEIDGRSDQYSLACVVYEMLVGEPPFTGPTAQAVLARQSLDMVSPPSIVRSTIPDAVEAAILRALAKLPADRYGTTALFAEALNTPSAATGAVRRATLAGARAPRPLWRRALPAAGAVALVATAAALFARRHAAPSLGSAGGLDPRHVAVMYFEDASQGKKLAYLADGLTEDLIAALTQVPSLTVISENGVAPYRGATVGPDSIARALSAGTVVQGSIEDAGTRYRLTIRLIDGASGVDFKRASFEQPVGELLVIRDSLAGRVADFLRERLGEEVRLREEGAGTRNAMAWSLVQQARQARKDAEALLRADSLPASAQAFRRVDSLAGQAQALDPDWPVPLVVRAATAYRQSRLDADPLHAAPWIDKGLGFVEQALKLDPRNPDALELRGTLRYWRYLLRSVRTPAAAAESLRRAEADLRASVALAPTQASAWSTLSHLSYQKPDFVEAKIDAQRAYEADAYLGVADQIVWRLYTTSYDLEQFADAAHWCQEGRRRFPTNPRFVKCQLWLMTADATEPNAREAGRLVDELHKLTPETQWPYDRLEAEIWMAAVLARAGLRDSARHLLARSTDDDPTVDPERELLSVAAFAYTLLGDSDQAIRLLQEQIAANPQHRVGLMKVSHWWWRKLRDDPRFKALVAAPR